MRIVSSARQVFSRLWSSEDGSVISLVAISSVAMVGLAAMVVDLSYAVVLQSRLQSAADSASLAAAAVLPDQTAAATQALLYTDKNLPASQNGTTLAANDVVFGNWDNDTRTFTPNPPTDPINAVDIRLRRASVNGNPVQTFFGSIFGIMSIDLSANAIAVANKGELTCLLVLDPDSDDALVLDSNAEIDVDGCTVHVNSTDQHALHVKSNANLTANSVCIAGSYQDDSSGGIDPTPEINCAQQLDPLAAMPEPDTSGCDVTNYSLGSNDSDTLSPGVYCGGISLSSNASVTFTPGTYVIKDGEFSASSNTTLDGTGVSFYLTGNDALIDFNSNTNIDLTASSSGDQAGVLFSQDPNYGGEHHFDSNSNVTFTGIIYLPNATLISSSNSNLSGPSNCLMLVVGKAEFNSNAGFVTTPDLENCPFEVPDGLFLTGQLALRQ